MPWCAWVPTTSLLLSMPYSGGEEGGQEGLKGSSLPTTLSAPPPPPTLTLASVQAKPFPPLFLSSLLICPLPALPATFHASMCLLHAFHIYTCRTFTCPFACPYPFGRQSAGQELGRQATAFKKNCSGIRQSSEKRRGRKELRTQRRMGMPIIKLREGTPSSTLPACLPVPGSAVSDLCLFMLLPLFSISVSSHALYHLVSYQNVNTCLVCLCWHGGACALARRPSSSAPACRLWKSMQRQLLSQGGAA